MSTVEAPLRYAITLPGPTGGHAPPRLVLVQATGEMSADGEPVSPGAHGALRVGIEPGGPRAVRGRPARAT